MINESSGSASPSVFIRKVGLASRPGAWMTAGFGLVLVAIAGMALAIMANIGTLGLQSMTTLPILFAIGSFLNARSLRRTPSRVVVSAAGLQLESGAGTRRIAWDESAWVAEQPVLFSSRKQLVLLDASGSAIDRILADLENYPVLEAIVRGRIGTRQDNAASTVRRARLRKQGWLLCLVSPLMILLAAENARMALRERADQRDLASIGVVTEGRILRRFIAPNGRTRRLEFEVTDASGLTARRNVEVDDATYEALAEIESVPVIAVPGRPRASHLLVGEIVRSDPGAEPAMMLVLSAFLALFMSGLFAAGIAAFLGYEVDWNKTTRKLSIQRVP
jgi:hypothetical protein